LVILAVPTGLAEPADFNDLTEGLGENGPIDFQVISELAPKPLSLQSFNQNDRARLVRLRGASEGRLSTIIGDVLMAGRLLTGWSLVGIRPGEPR
jgi:hypothetical protein